MIEIDENEWEELNYSRGGFRIFAKREPKIDKGPMPEPEPQLGDLICFAPTSLYSERRLEVIYNITRGHRDGKIRYMTTGSDGRGSCVEKEWVIYIFRSGEKIWSREK